MSESENISEERLGPCWFCNDPNTAIAFSTALKMRPDPAKTNSSLVGDPFVRVPRCWRCMRVHNRVKRIANIGALLGGVSGLMLCVGIFYIILQNGYIVFSLWLFLLVLLVVGMIGAFFGKLIGNLFNPKGIKGHGYAKQYPRVQQMIAEGWEVDPTSLVNEY